MIIKHNKSIKLFLRALETRRDVLATVVDEQGEVDGDVEIDAEDVGFKNRAEAQGDLGVGEASEKAAARLLRRLAELEVD